MSFVGGGSECSVNGNAVAQFNKHTQQDRSLQQQAANQGNIVQGQGFKKDNLMNARDRANLDQFMNNGSPQNSFQFQPMRHELNMILNQHQNPIHHQPQQQNNNWAQDFKSQSPTAAPSITKSASPMNGQVNSIKLQQLLTHNNTNNHSIIKCHHNTCHKWVDFVQ